MSSVMAKSVEKMARDLFCDFLTIAIHGLLHSRKVYPAGVFKLRQKFNIPVHVCYHPDVFNYISELVKEIGDTLSSQVLHAVHVIIGSKTCPSEQFTFKLHSFSKLISQDQLVSLEQALRACLLKLAIVDSYLPSPNADDDSGGCDWRVELDASDKLLANTTSWHKVVADSACLTNLTEKRKIIPLKTVSTDCIKLELFVKV